MEIVPEFYLKGGSTLDFSVLDNLIMLNSDFICGQFEMPKVGFNLIKSESNAKLECRIHNNNYQGWFFEPQEYLRLFAYFTKLGYLSNTPMPTELLNLTLDKVDGFIMKRTVRSA